MLKFPKAKTDNRISLGSRGDSFYVTGLQPSSGMCAWLIAVNLVVNCASIHIVCSANLFTLYAVPMYIILYIFIFAYHIYIFDVLN